jgi:hypothetical protein
MNNDDSIRTVSSPYLARRYRIPPLSVRLAWGGLIFVLLLASFVLLPYTVLGFVTMHGIQSGISTMTVVVIGVILSILGAARSVLKPTVAYGPIWMAGALLMVGYLLILAPGASFTIQVGGGTLSIQFGAIFLLLAIVPLLRAVAAGIITWEDVFHRGERLPVDFPP